MHYSNTKLYIKGMQNKGFATSLLLAIISCSSMAFAEVSCGPGEYLVREYIGLSERCEPCPIRQYQDKENHRETACRSCSPFDHFDFRLVLQDECTPSHYVIVRCVIGYYLDKGRCHKCKNCTLEGKFQQEACQGERDTLCGPDPHRLQVSKKSAKRENCPHAGSNSIKDKRNRRSSCSTIKHPSNGFGGNERSFFINSSRFIICLGLFVIIFRL